jgi:hypothetical protein
MDLYENVCLVKDRVIHMHSYSGTGSLSRQRHPNEMKGTPRQLSRTIDHPVSEWYNNHSSQVLVMEPTLMIQSIAAGNPAHCVNDLLVSLATSYGIDIPDQHVVVEEWKTIVDRYPPKHYWCSQALELSGFKAKQTVAAPRDTTSPLCFKKLYVPRFVSLRQIPHADSAQALRDLRTRLLQALNLSNEPWKPSKTPESHRASILLYSRQGSSRKILSNAHQIKNRVESLYHANVTLIGKEWGALNFTEQAALYNSFSYFIAPHGAHFANLIFSRPGTKVMELICSIGENNVAPNALGVTVGNPDLWYNTKSTKGHQDWFVHNSPALGHLEHFHFMEQDGCRLKDGKLKAVPPPQLVLNVTKFVPFMALRFGLKLRILPVSG